MKIFRWVILIFLLLLCGGVIWYGCRPDPPPPPTPTLTEVTDEPTSTEVPPTVSPTETKVQPSLTETVPSETDTPTPTEKPTFEPEVVTICTGYVEGHAHWRKGPGLAYLPFWWYDETGHPVGGWLPEGTELIFVEEVNPYEDVYWTEVLYEGKPGFTWSELICEGE